MVKGASPDGDRATAVEPVPVSPLRGGIPSAWQPWETAPRDGSPFCIGLNVAFDPSTGELLLLWREFSDDGERVVWAPHEWGPGVKFWSWTECSPFSPPDAAQAIEARRAETQGGSVGDESAVPKGCAQ